MKSRYVGESKSHIAATVTNRWQVVGGSLERSLLFASQWFRVGTSLLATVYALPSTRVNPWAVFLSSLLLCLLRRPNLTLLFPTYPASRASRIRIPPPRRGDGFDGCLPLASPEIFVLGLREYARSTSLKFVLSHAWVSGTAQSCDSA